jgi:serine protease Do
LNKLIAASSILFVSLCATPGQAQRNASDALRRDMEIARRKVYPALVNITVVTKYYAGGRAQRAPSGGSGVIVTPQGHVLTNFHVAGHSTRINCTLPSGETIEASVVTHDPLTDLSVLKLRLDKRPNPGSSIPYAKIGDSDKLEVGDYVLAMGNPLMLSSSMTLGVVSNTKRVFTDFIGTEIEDQNLDSGEKTGVFTRWIQHDALILPGNSGGPLVNLKGEVVGINELGGNGVGFAIPSNIARQVLQQALAHGQVRRGWLGISVLPVEKLGRKTGALVSAVAPGSPAEKAGIKPGQILLAIDGTPVNARFFEQVPLVYQRIAALQSGHKARLQVEAAGKARTVTTPVSPMEKYVGDEDEIRDLGITVQEITAPMALARKLPDNNGVLITGLRAGFPFEAAQPKIMEGDIVLSVNGQPTNTLAQFRKAVASAAKQEVAVAYRRRTESLVTAVKPPEDKSSNDDAELPKPWLGIRTQVVTPEVARALKMPDTKGFRVTLVYPWTEASKAGLKTGDVITSLNGNDLDASRPQDAEDLKRAIEELTIGEKAEIGVLRSGKAEKLAVLLEAPPAASDKAKRTAQKEFEFSARDVTPMDRMTNSWPRTQQGLLVTDVTTGGWASMSGLRVDDLILSVNGLPVNNVSDFDRAMARVMKSHPKVVRVFVLRGAATHFVFIEPDWAKLSAGR